MFNDDDVSLMDTWKVSMLFTHISRKQHKQYFVNLGIHRSCMEYETKIDLIPQLLSEHGRLQATRIGQVNRTVKLQYKTATGHSGLLQHQASCSTGSLGPSSVAAVAISMFVDD